MEYTFEEEYNQLEARIKDFFFKKVKKAKGKKYFFKEDFPTRAILPLDELLVTASYFTILGMELINGTIYFITEDDDKITINDLSLDQLVALWEQEWQDY